MKHPITTTVLAGTFVLAGTLSAFAGGCNYGHSVQETVADLADDSKVLTTGQISVAQIDCVATPDAPECAQTSEPVTN